MIIKTKNKLLKNLSLALLLIPLTTACSSALPKKSSSQLLEETVAQTEKQVRAAQRFAEEATKEREEAERLLAQARVFFDQAISLKANCGVCKPCPPCKRLPKPETSAGKAAEVHKLNERIIPEPQKSQTTEVKSSPTPEPNSPVIPGSDDDYSPSDRISN